MFAVITSALIPVYPCVYREHDGVGVSAIPAAGLSLCIQGTLIFFITTLEANRFIPVYTGNTNSPVILRIASPVYPCVYREHNSVNIKAERASGLSLCIQGTLRS